MAAGRGWNLGLCDRDPVTGLGPNGVGGAWCEDPTKVAIAGGAQFTANDIANDVAIRAKWPYTANPTNPVDRNGWRIQVNAPAGVDPGEVLVYAVCVVAGE